MRNIKFHLLAAACALVATQARADDVTFTGFTHGFETVTFTMSAPNVAKTEAVEAGGFATILNGSPSFETYCVDVYQTINFNTLYPEYTGPGTSHVFANANAYTDLARLYGTAGVIADAMHEAAFQIAVWEIAYETSGTYNLASGSASFSGGTAASSGALTLASSWLGSLAGSGPSITVLDSRLHQDVIYPAVPEPSTVVLMLMGLFGVAAVVRRRAGRGFVAATGRLHTTA